MLIEVGLIIAVIIGLTQLMKQGNFIPVRFIPLLSLCIGVLAGFFYVDGDLKTRLFFGVVIGLSANGLFDQSKIITKK